MRRHKVLAHRVTQLAFLLASFIIVPFAASAEEIKSFVSSIDLQTDGTFNVTEVISYDFEEAERHGIFRYIEKKHPQGASSIWKERFIEITLNEVMMDGAAVPYEVSDSKEKLEVKIGDPYATISGLHEYSISYTVRGGYSYFDDGGAEIYWNVTGNDWEVPIAKAVANINVDTVRLKEQRACYAGLSGGNTPCSSMTTEKDGSVTFEETLLSSGEGLTIAQSIDGGGIEVVVTERLNGVLFGLIVVPLLILGLIIFGYRYRTRYKTGAPIIAQYEPYENFKPMYAGMLFDGVLDPRDITAGIVYLAEQGFIKIKKVDRKVLFVFEVDDYELQLKRPFSEIENMYLKDVLSLIFPVNASIGDTITLSSLKTDHAKQHANLVKLQTLRKDLKKDMQAEGFIQIQTTLLKPMWVVGLILAGALFFIDFMIPLILPEFIFYFISGLTVCFIIFLIMYERRTRKGYEAIDHLKGFKLFLSVTDEERFKFHNAPQKSPEQFMQYLPYAIAFGVEKEWAKAFEGITIPNPSWYDGGSVGSFSAVNLTSSLEAFSTSFTASSGSSGSSGGGSSGGGGGGGGGGSW